MISYSNPRMSATIEQWPSGRNRVPTFFKIEQVPGRGERAIRTTTGADKKLTYARKARIVDGSDGHTYIAELSSFGHITIMQGNMKFQAEVVHERDARYAELAALFA